MKRTREIPSGMRVLWGATAAAVLLTGVGCVTNRKGDGVLTGRVNQLAILVHGTGRSGLAVTVNTYEAGRGSGVKAVVEEGALSFEIFAADAKGAPIPGQLVGRWTYDADATRRFRSPRSWLGRSTYSVLLPWRDTVPPAGMRLVLVTVFTPADRPALPPRSTTFEMSALGDAPQ